MRFNRNGCPECISVCPAGAIAIDEDISIDRGRCSECMLCMSACPSDCFSVESFDFIGILARLRKLEGSVPVPVLGCNSNNGLKAHVRTPCFGFLSHEHLLALATFPESGLQLNMTGCNACGNAFIVDIVREKYRRVDAESPIVVSERVKIVTDSGTLNYQDAAYDRRGFFNVLRKATCRQIAGLIEGDDIAMPMRSYSEKRLPLKRRLLNSVLVSLNGKGVELLKSRYYTITTGADCDNCFACVGICPSGALKVDGCDIDEIPCLSFKAALCNGCGLCRDVCFSNSLSIGNGFTGSNPFDFIPVPRQAG
jgi:ferredoxin